MWFWIVLGVPAILILVGIYKCVHAYQVAMRYFRTGEHPDRPRRRR